VARREVWVEITGSREVMQRLFRMAQGARNKILSPAVAAAVKPIATHAKFMTPVRTGMLRRSIGWRVIAYRRSGIVVGMIGPRTGFRTTRQGRVRTALGKRYKATGINPTRYSHLVEFGTHRSRAKPFLRPAWDAGRGRAVATVSRMVYAGLLRARHP
jgi:HK97 gp10 family phage protein